MDINDLVKKVSDELKTVATEVGLQLTIEAHNEPIMISGDESKLRQVFQNLIDNSIKYTKKGWINVKIQNESDKVVVTVSDSGIGIKPEVIGKLFTQFQRGSKEAKKIQGTGLGLFIAKQFVEAHKGTITPSSDGEGKGSQFRVELSK